MDTKSNKRPREEPLANKKRLVTKTIIYDESKPNQWLDEEEIAKKTWQQSGFLNVDRAKSVLWQSVIKELGVVGFKGACTLINNRFTNNGAGKGAQYKEKCLPGSAAANEGSAKCLSCTPGMYAFSYTSVTCNYCGLNEFANKPNQTSCKQCPNGKMTIGLHCTTILGNIFNVICLGLDSIAYQIPYGLWS